jgi:hypothetical protein
MVEVFGTICSSFKTINPYLHINIKRMFVNLHWQIHGWTVITNNEFMMWLMKGYITKLKGDLLIALATASTTRKKADR